LISSRWDGGRKRKIAVTQVASFLANPTFAFILFSVWHRFVSHALGLRVKVKPSFFSNSRTLDAIETDSCMPTTVPQLAQQTAPTSTPEPAGLIGMDANSVPSHFGHFGVTDLINRNGLTINIPGREECRRQHPKSSL
jgi:hypothetical protein